MKRWELTIHLADGNRYLMSGTTLETPEFLRLIDGIAAGVRNAGFHADLDITTEIREPR